MANLFSSVIYDSTEEGMCPVNIYASSTAGNFPNLQLLDFGGAWKGGQRTSTFFDHSTFLFGEPLLGSLVENLYLRASQQFLSQFSYSLM